MFLESFKEKIPYQVIKICKILHDNEFQAYLVGGAVRDLFIGRAVKDWDIATSAMPSQLVALFPFCIKKGLDYGTIGVNIDGITIEVTSFRCAEVYAKGAHQPVCFQLTNSIEEDLSRRDLTINAIAYSVIHEFFFDPFNGIGDLTAGVIRAVGDAHQRFKEDPLRILRAGRLWAQLNSAGFPFYISEDINKAAQEFAGLLINISKERITEELRAILLTNFAGFTFRFYLAKNNILPVILPELASCKDFDQESDYHPETLLNHMFSVLDNIVMSNGTENIALRLAALYHDVGKPEVKELGGSHGARYPNHATKSAITAKKELLSRTSFSHKDIELVDILIQNHMIKPNELESGKAIRRFIERVGIDNVPLLCKLLTADGMAIDNEDKSLSGKIILEMIENYMSIDTACVSASDLAIDGNVIAQYFARGPLIGVVINTLLDYTAEFPERNTKEELTDFVKQIQKAYQVKH